MADVSRGVFNGLSLTTYIDEFYYYASPNDGLLLVENGEWRNFVNTPARSLSILFEPAISDDETTSYSEALLSFEQVAIETFYNRDPNDEILIGFGMAGFDSGTPASVPHTSGTAGITKFKAQQRFYDNVNSGLANAQVTTFHDNSGNLLTGTDLPRWDTFLNTQEWRLKADYDNVIYRYLLSNRDDNGNGIIDVNEMKWHLPSIAQINYMWIGQNALSFDSRLYKYTDYSKTWKFHLANSLILPASGYVNLQFNWSHEGSSVGDFAWTVVRNSAVSIRMFRTFGRTPQAETNIVYSQAAPTAFEYQTPATQKKIEMATPQSPPSGVGMTIEAYYEIDLVGFNESVLRGYTQSQELEFHQIFDADNSPRRKFHVADMNGVNMKISYAKSYIPRRSYYQNINAANDLTGLTKYYPTGWRMPNQRELSIMTIVLPCTPTTKGDYGWGDITDGAEMNFHCRSLFLEGTTSAVSHAADAPIISTLPSDPSSGITKFKYRAISYSTTKERVWALDEKNNVTTTSGHGGYFRPVRDAQ